MHVTDATVLIFLATICVSLQRMGTAVIIGGLGVWVLLH
jgi:hypothetical protein